MKQEFDIFYTPLGKLYCLARNEKIALLHPNSFLLPKDSVQSSSNPLLQDCKKQIQAYFSHHLKHFTLPLEIQGSLFTQNIFQALLQIPYGETLSYNALSTLAGYPKAYRATGSVLSKNLLLLLLPCHRIICSNGKLGDYVWGKDKKQKLINNEILGYL